MARPIPKEVFYFVPLALGLVFAWIAWKFLRPDSGESQFQVREADRKGPATASAADLAQAKMKRNEPLQLMGIRIDGPPHQILGVSIQATPPEIQKAYRDLMKRYHPDKIGPQGSREWKDAQRIAEAINRAKDALLKQRLR